MDSMTEQEQLVDAAERLTERKFGPDTWSPEVATGDLHMTWLAQDYFNATLDELTAAAAVLAEVGYAPSEAIYAIRGLERARRSFTGEEYPDELHAERLNAAYTLLAVPQERP